MYKKLNDLQFVIGLFFSVISAILLLHVMLANDAATKLNTLTGGCFMVFGVLMMLIRGKKA